MHLLATVASTKDGVARGPFVGRGRRPSRTKTAANTMLIAYPTGISATTASLSCLEGTLRFSPGGVNPTAPCSRCSDWLRQGRRTDAGHVVGAFARTADVRQPSVNPAPIGSPTHVTRDRDPRGEVGSGRASMVDRWRRSSSSKSPSTAQNLSASLVSGARCWGTSYRRHRRGLLLGTISIARCRLSSQGSAFACIDPSGVGPRLFFQRVPEGKVVKNRLHLDVRVGTGLVGEERLAALEAECARLVALGAVRVRLLLADGDDESCLVMQDIEGNEFCLD